MDRIEQESSEGNAERRRAPRRKVLRSVQIVTLDKRSTIDCILLSISSSGALINAHSARDIPESFYLRAPGQSSYVLCRVVRRTLTNIAMIFEAESKQLSESLQLPADLTPPSPSHAA
jgi:hypothetical protein